MGIVFSKTSTLPYEEVNNENPLFLEKIISGIKDLKEIYAEEDIYVIFQNANCSEVKIFTETLSGFGINFEISLLNPDNSVVGFSKNISFFNINSLSEDVVKKIRIRFSIIDNIYLIKNTKIQTELQYLETFI